MVDAFYGLTMVVLHSMMLAEVQEPVRLAGEHAHPDPFGKVGGVEGSNGQEQPQAFPGAEPGAAPGSIGAAPESPGLAAPGVEPPGARRRLEEHVIVLPPAHERQPTSLFVQLLDLDIGWGHSLLGFQDKSNMTSGLIYGIVIILSCLYMLSLVMGQTSSNARPTVMRWFVGFMHVQLILYIFLVIVKMSSLCDIQPDYLPHLDMDCPLLRASYAQRVSVLLAFALVGTWIFASFTWFLTFGQGAERELDKPQFGAQLDMDTVGRGQQAPAASLGGAYLSRLDAQIGNANGSFMPQRAAAGVGNSVGVGYNAGGAGGGRGASFLTPAAAGSQAYAMASVAPAARHSLAPAGSSHIGQSFGGLSGAPQYNLGGHHNMARASSSMVTSTTEHSQAETQALIKPPVAVF